MPYEDNAPYERRRPPGPRGRRRPVRWSRPEGTLPERLSRARLVHLLARRGRVGDWIALCLGGLAVAAVLVASHGDPAQGRLRAPHLGLDYALDAVQPGPAGIPELASIHGAGPGLARTLASGDLVAVETAVWAGWYRIERVEQIACGEPPRPGGGLVLITACGQGRATRTAVFATPAGPAHAGWI